MINCVVVPVSEIRQSDWLMTDQHFSVLGRDVMNWKKLPKRQISYQKVHFSSHKSLNRNSIRRQIFTN